MKISEDQTTDRILGAAIRVHRELGPGFLEAVYEEALAIEFAEQGIAFERQKPIAVLYHEQHVGEHRLDFLVESRVIVELKAVEQIHPLHEAQLMTYLRLSGCRIGLLINVNTVSLTDGIRRRVL